MKVKDIMNKVVVAEDNLSIGEAAKIMSEKSIGSLVLINKKNVSGIITESDILKAAAQRNLGISVRTVMAKKVYSVSSDDCLDDAAEIMKKRKIKRLPVIDNGRLFGIITATDLLANSDELNEDFLLD
ncbi:CBS domain-containing protein [Candidatus Woesearchaeota archaeon CG10_big_fil_rev_8_21_14_0_10_34_12]|nr:MAG: CBS domain-containing protein [Candidatus Woesearchaeota archaeon CG10_big_fil_rev_8_21_14_0_10_34_12]